MAAGEELAALIRSSDWLMRVLTAVRDEHLPDAWVGAGVLRDLVWGERFGDGFRPGLADLLGGVWRRNPRRVSPECSRERLARHRPGERWPAVTVVGEPPGLPTA